MTRQNGHNRHNGYNVTFREALGAPLKGGDEARLRRGVGGGPAAR
ncbi:MAG: hypothetical protein R2844_19605 [Caldilineales bacterium]